MRQRYGMTAAVWLMAIGTAAATISTAELKRLQNATDVVRDMRGQPDKGIPQKLWDRAACGGDSRPEEGGVWHRR